MGTGRGENLLLIVVMEKCFNVDYEYPVITPYPESKDGNSGRSGGGV